MPAMLLAIGVTVAGCVALGVLWAYYRSTGSQRVVAARLVPRSDLAFNPTGVLRTRRQRLPLLNRLPISREGRLRTQVDLDRAGLRWRAQEFLALRLCLGLASAVTVAAVLAGAGFEPTATTTLALLAMVLGWLLPQAYLLRRRSGRVLAVETQLPDALTAMAKSLRAGTGLLQALSFAANETPEPLGPELEGVLRDLQLGADPVEAFGALSERVGNADLDIAVTAIIIQRSVGGNLSEILYTVTNTIRERAKIHREVRVLVARQMLQANLTAALPISVAMLFVFVSPDIGRTLVNTTVGNIALGFAAVSEALGIYVVRRLAVIEV